MVRTDARRYSAGAIGRAAEAAAFLLAARTTLEIIPFRRLSGWFTRPPLRPEPAAARRRELVAGVRRAIAAAAVRLPGDTVCLPRAMAAQAMLRRRGVSTTLYYGVTRSTPGGLQAHAWLQSEDGGVVGHEAAPAYNVLATYRSNHT